MTWMRDCEQLNNFASLTGGPIYRACKPTPAASAQDVSRDMTYIRHNYHGKCKRRRTQSNQTLAGCVLCVADTVDAGNCTSSLYLRTKTRATIRRHEAGARGWGAIPTTTVQPASLGPVENRSGGCEQLPEVCQFRIVFASKPTFKACDRQALHRSYNPGCVTT